MLSMYRENKPAERKRKKISAGINSIKLSFAFHFLSIDEAKFNRIHTLAAKKKHLKYKYLKKEFAIIEHKYKSQISKEKRLELLSLAEEAYHIILQSHYIEAHTDQYSASSIGLMELETRSLYAEDKNNPADQQSVKLNQSIMQIGKKETGVEPGFEAIQAEDVIHYVAGKFPDKYKRWDFIELYEGNIKTIHAQFKDELPKYLIKLTYEIDDKKNKIMPDKTDLKRCKSIQDIYDKSIVIGNIATQVYQFTKACTTIQKNIEAVLEVLGNDIARNFGMKVQEQFLYLGTYKNQILKLMLKAKWIQHATTLKPMSGGQHNNNYCVKDVVLIQDGIKSISDHSIQRLAEYLPLFILLGDHDAIGSQGQNKLRLRNDLIGIDFGHVYQTNIIDKTAMNFEVMDPRFKNYTIFYDHSRSQIVRGLIKIARLSGLQLHESVVKSYGEEFFKEVQGLSPNSEEKLFDDYIKKFSQLAEEFQITDEISRENKKCCYLIIKKLQEIKTCSQQTRLALLEKFKIYLQIESKLVDLIKNVEDVFYGAENTTLRSEDGTVILHHLRRKNKKEMSWITEKSTQGEIKLIATFENHDDAKSAYINLLEWIALSNSQVSPVSPSLIQNQINLTFAEQQYDLVCHLFKEYKIKSYFHPKDYAHYNHYLDELELIQALNIFPSHGVTFHLKNHPSKEECYHLTIQAEKGVFKDWQELIDRHFSSFMPEHNSETISLVFHKNSISTINKLFIALPLEEMRETEIKNQTHFFLQNIAELKALQPIEAHLERVQNHFSLRINYEQCDPHFQKILIENLLSFHEQQNEYLFNYDQFYLVNLKLQATLFLYKTKKEELEKERLIKEEEERKIKKERVLQQQWAKYNEIKKYILHDLQIPVQLSLIYNKDRDLLLFTIHHTPNEQFIKLLTDSLHDFKKDNNYVIRSDQFQYLNEKILQACEKYSEKQLMIEIAAQAGRDRFIQLVSQLSSLLHRSNNTNHNSSRITSLFLVPTAILQIPKNIYHDYFDSQFTAAKVKLALDHFLSSNTKFSQPSLQELIHLLHGRANHILHDIKDKEAYEEELKLIQEITHACFFHQTSPQYELKNSAQNRLNP